MKKNITTINVRLFGRLRGSVRAVLNMPKVLDRIERTIDCMAKILDELKAFAATQAEFNTRQETAIDGIVEDGKFLKAKITELETLLGDGVPQEAKDIFSDLNARAEAQTTKLEALDNDTPPQVPPVE